MVMPHGRSGQRTNTDTENGTLVQSTAVPASFQHPTGEFRYLVWTEDPGWQAGVDLELYHAKTGSWRGTYRVVPWRRDFIVAWDVRDAGNDRRRKLPWLCPAGAQTSPGPGLLPAARRQAF